MAENSKIEWTDHTFNPWVGCTKISPACDHCYAEAWAKRTGGAALWQGGERRRTSAANWNLPLKWDRQAERDGMPRRVFCASLADVFDNQVPDEWRRDLFDIIRVTLHLDWQLLTKRPQNIAKMLPADWGAGWPHVLLGTTVANQEEANRNIPHLLAVPAARRFLSCEPLLGPINLRAIDVDGHHETDSLRPSTWREVWEGDWSPEATGMPIEECIRDFVEEGGKYPPSDARPQGIDWVICGGESGPSARPMHPDWARGLRDQCQAASVPFFFKQWGEWAPHRPSAGGDLGGDVRRGAVRIVHPTAQTDVEVAEATGGRNSIQGSRYMALIGKKAAGALLDGREWRETPGTVATPDKAISRGKTEI